MRDPHSSSATPTRPPPSSYFLVCRTGTDRGVAQGVVSEVPGDAERLDALEHLAGCPVDDADPGVDLIGAPVLVERVPGDGELDGGFAAVPGGGVRAGKEVVGERVLAHRRTSARVVVGL